MDKLNESVILGNLFNFYKNLLTKKQQEIFVSHDFYDIGLSEISSNLNISRQAVLDSLKKTNKLLKSYESKLKLYSIFVKQRKIVEEIQSGKGEQNLNEILNVWEGE